MSHLTPRYAIDKLLRYHYERVYPDAPWLTADAISILSSVLRVSDRGLEYGSGRSTLWLAKRTGSLTSLEHSRQWYERVNAGVLRERVCNVNLKHVPADARRSDDPYRADYVDGDPELQPESLDYALVDGIYRDACALRVTNLIKTGGLLIVDNANWFIPHSTRSPTSARTVASPGWSEFLFRVANWRLIWTTNGVTDTAMWFKAV